MPLRLPQSLEIRQHSEQGHFQQEGKALAQSPLALLTIAMAATATRLPRWASQMASLQSHTIELLVSTPLFWSLSDPNGHLPPGDRR